ncbi:TIGR02587 family membrane protein [soil metagenome]
MTLDERLRRKPVRSEIKMQTIDHSIQCSLREYGRGIAGGLLFSLPMLYTMEMWQFGFILSPGRMLIYAIVAYVLLLGYNRYAGLHEDATWHEVAIDSVEEIGIGLVLSAFFLVIIGRITLDTGLSEAVGKAVIVGMTVAIGVSIGTAQLGVSRNGEASDQSSRVRPSTFHEQLVIAFIAAILVSANIAPTDEIMILGMALSPLNLIALAILSLGLSTVILFYADFAGSARHMPDELTYLTAISKSSSSYVVALLVSALMLWFFGRFDGVPLIQMLSSTITLGLVSALGASAGRLLLQ